MNGVRNEHELRETLYRLPPNPAADTMITLPVFLVRRLLGRIDDQQARIQEQARELELHREIARLRVQLRQSAPEDDGGAG